MPQNNKSNNILKRKSSYQIQIIKQESHVSHKTTSISYELEGKYFIFHVNNMNALCMPSYNTHNNNNVHI